MFETANMRWRADYDVIVLGFGGAGGTAARFAADQGSHVLIVEAAPFGHEGGNTRYAAQHVAMAHDKNAITAYYRALSSPFHLPDSILSVYLDGFVKMPQYFEKYLGIKPFVWSHDVKPGDPLATKAHLAEYPEYPSSETFDFALVHARDFDAGLWKIIRQAILKRQNKIDVWLNSRAEHLILDPVTHQINGVEITRQGHTYLVHAQNGVILATGGFENNVQMQQDFLHVARLTPLGTRYNRGSGIRMAQEIGAKLWHMGNYESLGVIPSYTFEESAGERGRQISHWKLLYSGSILAVADDGTRFMPEDAGYRHGHIYQHGEYLLPHAYESAWLIFDQVQYDAFVAELKVKKQLRYPKFMSKLVRASDLISLSQKIKVPENHLKQTIQNFNLAAEQGKDLQFGRSPETMRAFQQGNVYAIKLAPAILNTQGGPMRDEEARVLDTDLKPIGHLYSAGELGGICVNRYQGGGNLAECLIFGKIAGENAAKIKQDRETITVSKPLPQINDLVDGEKIGNVSLGAHQYLGISEAGMGGKIVVRVTYQDDRLQQVEVLSHHETEGIGLEAIKRLPNQMVTMNSAHVDAVSGASTTTRALTQAVDQALEKAKQDGE